jgi:hypothetical protein
VGIKEGVGEVYTEEKGGIAPEIETSERKVHLNIKPQRAPILCNHLVLLPQRPQHRAEPATEYRPSTGTMRRLGKKELRSKPSAKQVMKTLSR